MKKVIGLLAIFFSLCFFATSNVNADNWNLLTIFVNNQNFAPITINAQENISLQIPYQGLFNLEDTINFEAMMCSISDSMIDSTTNQVEVSKSQCQAIDATFSSSNTSVLAMNGSTGTVKDFGDTKVTANYEDGGYVRTINITILSKSDSNSDVDNSGSGSNNGGNTNSDVEWKYLFVVDDNTKTVSFDQDTAISTKINKKLYIGDKAQFYAYVCSDTKASKSENKLTWNISDCEKQNNVKWSKTDASNAAFTIDQNGLVTAVKSGFSFDWIHAEVNKSKIDVDPSDAIYFNNTQNDVVISVEDAVYDGKNGNNNDESYKVNVSNTASNTSIIIMVFGVVMIGVGGYLLYSQQKKKEFSK